MDREKLVREYKERQAKRKKELEEFKLPDSLKNKVVHAMPDLIVFEYHGSRIDLTKIDEKRMLKMAQAKDCAVLQEIDENNQVTGMTIPEITSHVSSINSVEELELIKKQVATQGGKAAVQKRIDAITEGAE